MTRIALLAVALLAVTAVADDKKKVTAAPDEKAMTEAWAKMATPGAEHKKLDPLAGEWTYTAKFWMAPGAPPMEMKGEDKSVWIMDGRFLKGEVGGPAQNGMPPFQGVSVTGYDNSSKKYVSSWIDNMTTAITPMTGEMDAAGKVLTFHYEEFDPMIGKKVKARQVIRITGHDSHVLEFYKAMPDGKDSKAGEIVYTRKK
jgi:hypothetical protein